MTSTLDKTIDLRHYLQIPKRRKGILLLATVAVVCSAVIGLSFIPKQYESSAALMIEERQPLSKELNQVMGETGQAAGNLALLDQMRLTQLIGQVQSQPFLEEVARALRMTSDPAVLAEAEKRHKKYPDVSADDLAMRIVVDNLRSRITFRSRGTGIYDIVVADFNPKTARLLARYISELFRTHRRSSAMDQFRAARDFGEEQLTLQQEKLRRSEEALERFQGSMIRNGLERSKVRDDNVPMAELLLRRIEDEAKTAESRVVPLQRAVSQTGLTASEATVRDNIEIRRLEDQLALVLTRAIDDRLAVASAEKGSGTGESALWPPQGGSFVELRRSLAQSLEKHARAVYPRASDEAIRTISSYVFQRVDAEAESKAVRYLSDQIAVYGQRAQAQPVDEMDLKRLQNEAEKDRQMLEIFRNQVIASNLRQSMEVSLGFSLEILDPANLPLAPSRPNRPKILVGALLIGPLLGALFAFLAETMDSTLRSLHEIQRLAPEPVLCTAPLLTKLRPRKRGLRRHWVPAAVTSVVGLTAVFFLVRETVLQDRMAIGRSIQTVDPGVTDHGDSKKP
jgi:succinoglycan biosynthesis transport protein ExoP